MSTPDEPYAKYNDDTGEPYYCPVDSVTDEHIVSEWELDECVEASTAGRYSGNLDVKDRFSD